MKLATSLACMLALFGCGRDAGTSNGDASDADSSGADAALQDAGGPDATAPAQDATPTTDAAAPSLDAGAVSPDAGAASQDAGPPFQYVALLPEAGAPDASSDPVVASVLSEYMLGSYASELCVLSRITGAFEGYSADDPPSFSAGSLDTIVRLSVDKSGNWVLSTTACPEDDISALVSCAPWSRFGITTPPSVNEITGTAFSDWTSGNSEAPVVPPTENPGWQTSAALPEQSTCVLSGFQDDYALGSTALTIDSLVVTDPGPDAGLAGAGGPTTSWALCFTPAIRFLDVGLAAGTTALPNGLCGLAAVGQMSSSPNASEFLDPVPYQTDAGTPRIIDALCPSYNPIIEAVAEGGDPQSLVERFDGSVSACCATHTCCPAPGDAGGPLSTIDVTGDAGIVTAAKATARCLLFSP